MAKQEVLGLTGDEAIAYAAKQVDPDVVSAYPITPQTIIVERFSEYVADGLVHTEFVPVESEHTALSACVGAAAAGARAFTATASQGLALMWEILYIAASLRLPIVMAVVNRALSAPINIHCDHSDTMGARDSGWIQLYCENSQEAYDTTIQAWRIAEHPEVQLPVMVTIDGFVLSHTLENVRVLPDDVVRRFIGERQFIKVVGHEGREVPLVLDPENPLTLGAFGMYTHYFEYKVQQAEAMEKAKPVIEEVGRAYGEISGRTYGLVHPYKLEDADVAIVGLGSTMGTAKTAVDILRADGVKAGLLRIRSFRPFPREKILESLSHVRAIGVLDRAMSFGAYGGPLFMEMRSLFYDADAKPLMSNYIYGLGGRDMPVSLLVDTLRDVARNAERGRVEEPIRYMGVRE
ncbi:pyruvate ferredoxin oxidoreductase [archaeon]|nr:MAG: pyruvate ferredoxin oxidoreductase [archaeon]